MPAIIERIVFKAQSAVTATAETEEYPLSISQYSSIFIVISCSAVSGTNPTLDIFFQGCGLIGDPGIGLQTVPQQTGTFTLSYTVTPVMPKVWARWTIGGTATPTFTFKILMFGKIL
jgi:hypothetical protein